MKTILYAALAVALIAAGSSLLLTRAMEQSSELAYSSGSVRL